MGRGVETPCRRRTSPPAGKWAGFRVAGRQCQAKNVRNGGGFSPRRRLRRALRASVENIRRMDNRAEPRYCETMKNITVSVDDETYRRARIRAAERETSVSALVKQFLTQLAAQESDPERLLREERELRARVTKFSASDRLSRDELYERRR